MLKYIVLFFLIRNLNLEYFKKVKLQEHRKPIVSPISNFKEETKKLNKILKHYYTIKREFHIRYKKRANKIKIQKQQRKAVKN